MELPNVVKVKLTAAGLWALFVGVVCIKLDAEGFTGDKFALALSLDMSFEEIAKNPIEQWNDLINAELDEFRAENPGEFATRH